MDYFPLFVRLKDARCLVIGGGEVALRKTRLLLRAEAAITVIAPEIHDELAKLAKLGDLDFLRAQFEPAALREDYRFVVAATGDAAVNQQVATAAAQAGVFCNVVDDRELSTAIMPAIVDRSPILIAVSSGGESPVLTTRIRQQLEHLFPHNLGKLANFAGEWRNKVKARFRTIQERRHFWQRILEGPVGGQVMTGNIEAAVKGIEAEIAGKRTMEGFAWIVGAGPGDPELLTLKAAKALGSADTILHDRLVAPTILELGRRDAEFISVGKQAGKASISQEEINALLVEKVAAGNQVCRLKGGDPFIFGRGGEEIDALETAGLPWQVIPGITAASGCAAEAGAPLTHREMARSVLFVTASNADDADPDWEAISKAADTLVFYMAVGKLAHVCANLSAAGKGADCPALLIENGTTDRQRMIRGTLDTLASLADKAQAKSPAVLLVGPVTELARLASGNDLDEQAGLWAPVAKIAG